MSVRSGLSILLIGFQAMENNEEVKLKMKRENSEELQTLVPDKVCLLFFFC